MSKQRSEAKADLVINEQENIGKCRYVVNYYTGKKHSDGSDFYDVAIFTNKRQKARFVKQLRSAYR